MTKQTEIVRLLGLSGSLRAASFSTAILRAVQAQLAASVNRKVNDGHFQDQESLAFNAAGIDQLRQQVLSQREAVLQ
jgi:NAD(P)H-dependent FMN reductase